MNYPMAIVFSATLLAGSCVMNQPPAISQSGNPAKFQIVSAGPQSAWRLNTGNGVVGYCSAATSDNVTCVLADWTK